MKFDNFVNIYNFLILFGRSDRLRIVCYREFLVGRAIRRLGTGSDEVSTRSQKGKTLIISLCLATKKITGAPSKLHNHQSGYAGSIVLCPEKFNTCFCAHYSFRAL